MNLTNNINDLDNDDSDARFQNENMWAKAFLMQILSTRWSSLSLETQEVLFNSSFSLEVQVSAVNRSVFAQLTLVDQLFLFLEMSNLVTVTHGLDP